jgi:hypothetical protein
MNAEAPRPVTFSYARSGADLDKFMEFVWSRGEGKPLTFDVYYTAKAGWQVVMVCEDQGLVHSPAHARRFARSMRAVIARRSAAVSESQRRSQGTSGAFAICDAWDSRAKLALERNRNGVKPN